MTSTVDIDSKLDKILIRARINNNTPRQVYIDDVKSLIREVAEEVITTKTKRAKSDYENGWNDCVDTCNENLNRLLGKEKK